jgi:manganese efflux pump family protein
MNFIIIIFIAIGLGIDACVVSITKGMMDKTSVKHALIIAMFLVDFKL